MSDLISRADALEAIKLLPVQLDAETVQRCIEAVSNLPSAQPVRHGKWILEHEEPTVDAIPISWIKEWVEEIKDHPAYTEKEKTLCIEEFEDMIGAWSEWKEE